MKRIFFPEHLTALDVREPIIDICTDIAEDNGLHAVFNQRQQPAFSGYASQRKSARKRIGNGKHKDWTIDYQIEHPSKSNPNVVGTIAIKAPYNPGAMIFGGFDYGTYGQPEDEIPRYDHITLCTPSELDVYRPIDPEPDLLELTYEGIARYFELGSPRLIPLDDIQQHQFTTAGIA